MVLQAPPPAYRAFRPLAMSDVSIQRCVSISWGKSQKPWVLRDLECIDGVEFVVLSKRDYGFVRFVTSDGGDATQMRFLDRLRELRTKATFEAIAPNPSLFDESVEPSRQERKRAKTVGMQQGIPPIVSLTLPAFTMEDGMEVGPCTVRVKASLDASFNVAVELDAKVLQHIKLAMRHSIVQARQDSVGESGKAVYWRNDKKCYIAIRTTGNQKVTRTVRPESPSEEAMVAARDKAKQWASSSAAAGDISGEAEEETQEAEKLAG